MDVSSATAAGYRNASGRVRVQRLEIVVSYRPVARQSRVGAPSQPATQMPDTSSVIESTSGHCALSCATEAHCRRWHAPLGALHTPVAPHVRDSAPSAAKPVVQAPVATELATVDGHAMLLFVSAGHVTAAAPHTVSHNAQQIPARRTGALPDNRAPDTIDRARPRHHADVAHRAHAKARRAAQHRLPLGKAARRRGAPLLCKQRRAGLVARANQAGGKGGARVHAFSTAPHCAERSHDRVGVPS